MKDGTRTQAELREQRRAAALRQNLKRRKAQSRAQLATGPEPGEAELTPPVIPPPDPSDPGEQGK
jgi:hypothetical protein